jgi:hypothetical protein
MERAKIEEASVAAPLDLPVLSYDESKRLMEGPFGAQLHNLVVLHTTYLVFGTKGRPGEAENLRNGTCFFMKTPQRLFGVTARHVIEGLQQAREAQPETICRIGGALVLDPVERMIDAGRKADIATFDIKEDELNAIKKWPITLWPPHPPDVDDSGVIFAGFPAAAITCDDAWTRVFGIYAASGMAQRVTDWQLSCSVEWDHIVASGLGQVPAREYDTGGMSGGPMLSIRTRRGLMDCPLAGVISEGRRESDTIVAERADCLLANGTIRT